MKNNIQVSALNIYPVKSLAGIPLQSSEIDEMGLKYDRRWMLVTSDGKFMSQRTTPRMALISTSLNHGQLSLSTAGRDPHQVALTTQDSEKMNVVVWKDSLKVSRVGADTDAWLSDALGIECHLVYIEDDVVRQCNLDYSDEGNRTGFSDAFPILLVSEESLADLNERLEKPVDMRRFRPNIVITGCDAFAEDKFNEFSIGNLSMKGVRICSRCPLPMVDPDMGERTSQEPIATLSTYRKWDGSIFFGMNVIHQQLGTITVGDSLNITTLHTEYIS